MRALFGAIYWIVVGVLTVAGIYVSVFGTLFPLLLVVALAMGLFGAWQPGFRYSWAALIGFGLLPALLLSSNLLVQVLGADWSCSEISFQPGETVAYGGGSSEEEVLCATVPGQLIVASAVFWAMVLFGVAMLYFQARIRPDGRWARLASVSGVAGLGAILLMVAGGIGLSVMKATAPPSPPEKAGLPPNGLPISCSEGEEDIGIFNGVGSETLPEVELIGAGWHYVYNSSGSGVFSIEALDENGDTVPSSAVSDEAGGEGRSPRIEAQGAFNLKIEADQEVGHTVKVCDETHPSGRNKGTIKVGES